MEECLVAERLVGREQVLAFRASAQSLDRRRPATELAGVAGACGVQDTPPGNAEVSLAARLDVDGPVVKEAVASKKLVLAWSLRGAPHVFPPEDFAVFTLGARPADDTLEALWGQPERALVEVEKAMVGVLGSEPSSKGEVSAAVTAVLPAELAPWCRGVQGPPPERERLPGDAAARPARPDQHGPGAADQGQDVAGRRRRRRPRRPPNRAAPALPALLRADDVGPLRRVGGHHQVRRQAAVGGGRRLPRTGPRARGRGSCWRRTSPPSTSRRRPPACACSPPRTRSSRPGTATSSSPIPPTARPSSRPSAAPASCCTRLSRWAPGAAPPRASATRCGSRPFSQLTKAVVGRHRGRGGASGPRARSRVRGGGRRGRGVTSPAAAAMLDGDGRRAHAGPSTFTPAGGPPGTGREGRGTSGAHDAPGADPAAGGGGKHRGGSGPRRPAPEPQSGHDRDPDPRIVQREGPVHPRRPEVRPAVRPRRTAAEGRQGDGDAQDQRRLQGLHPRHDAAARVPGPPVDSRPAGQRSPGPTTRSASGSASSARRWPTAGRRSTPSSSTSRASRSTGPRATSRSSTWTSPRTPTPASPPSGSRRGRPACGRR